MKNLDILNHLEALSKGMYTVGENGVYEYPRLPVSVLWAITGARDALQKAAVLYEEGRQKIIETYAARDENGQILVSESEEILFNNDEEHQRCMSDISELLDMDTDVSFRKIRLSELDVCDSSPKYDSLSLKQMDALKFMIEEG